ncbi:unnamed protein product, partial [Sphagnum compactum]
MVRRHGWQLPAHMFQVVAITIFFLLVIAFYIFMAPFLWTRGLDAAAYAIYTPLAFTVFILYIRCSAIDPADPGVFGNQPLSKHDEKSSFSQASAAMTPAVTGVPLSPALSSPRSVLQSEKDYDRRASYAEQGRVGWNAAPSLCSFAGFCGLCCGWMVIEDKCFNEGRLQQPVPEEDVLFCTLCNAEVRKFSKHCRSCDKCVDGFDHHCRWLNNCVGKKNYTTFVVLMATSLALLAVEFLVGAAVFVRCFVDKRATEEQIISKLGNGFSTAPFATVVAICTIVALLASVPLGELFFFHLLLIKKGITTYEYVVAMRAQNESPTFGDGEQSMASSHSSSAATGMSGSSSVGLQYRGGWCTPPRIFVEHQDEILPHLARGRVPSTKDPDAMGAGRPPKRSSGTVRISAWRLAKLNADEAARAAAKARENSSVLKPLGPRDVGGIPETDYSSSSNISSRSSLSIDYGLKTGLRRGREDVPSALPSLQSGLAPIRTGRVSALPTDLADAGMENKNSVSSNSASSTVADSIAMSPHPTERKDGPSEMPSTSMADTSAIPSVAETSLNPSMADTIVAEASGKPIPSASSSIFTESGLKSTMTRSRSPLLPSGRSQTTSHAGTSIFYDGPILPIRDTANSRRHSSQILPPKPPLDPRSSGVHKQPGPENRSSSRGSALPVFTPS